MLGPEIPGLIAVILVALWFRGSITTHVMSVILALVLVALWFLELVTANTMAGILLVISVVVVLARIIHCVKRTKPKQNA